MKFSSKFLKRVNYKGIDASFRLKKHMQKPRFRKEYKKFVGHLKKTFDIPEGDTYKIKDEE